MSLDEFELSKFGSGRSIIIVQPPDFRGKLSEDVLHSLRDFYARERMFPLITWEAEEQTHYDTGIINYSFSVFKERTNGPRIFMPDNFYGFVKLEEQTEVQAGEKVVEVPEGDTSKWDCAISQGKYYRTFDPKLDPTKFYLMFFPSKHQQSLGRTGNRDRNDFLNYVTGSRGLL